MLITTTSPKHSLPTILSGSHHEFPVWIHTQPGLDVFALDDDVVKHAADEQMIDLANPAVVLQPQIMDDRPVFAVLQGEVDVVGSFLLPLGTYFDVAQLLLDQSRCLGAKVRRDRNPLGKSRVGWTSSFPLVSMVVQPTHGSISRSDPPPTSNFRMFPK